MVEVLSITTPIFAVIAVGYGAVRLGWFSKSDTRTISKFVMSFALPSLLFKALSQHSFDEVMNVPYLAAYSLGSVIVMAIGLGTAYFWQKRSLQVSVLNGLGMSVSNSGFIGYPIVLQLLGPPAAVALALTMIVENILMIPLSLSLAEAGASGASRHKNISLMATLVPLTRNPLILAIAAGMICAMIGIHLPQTLTRTIDMFAVASGAGALFVIGGTLVGLRPASMLGDMARIGTGKLLLHPFAVSVAFLMVPAVDRALRMAAITFACMPMLSIYPILAQKYGEEERCAAALLATTLVSFASISAGIWAMHLLFQQ